MLAGLAALTARDPRVDVAAVVSWFGFSDIAAFAARSPLEAKLVPPGPEAALLGTSTSERIRAASPVNHVHADAPPFLIAHGDRDQIVDLAQSRRLHEALTQVGADSTFIMVGGAGHEDPKFDDPAMIGITAAFLRSRLACSTPGSGPTHHYPEETPCPQPV